MPPPPSPYQQGGQPPVGYGGSYAPPYASPPLPPGGNSSGMGPNYAAPPEAQGWTFGGCVPFGLFAFVNNFALWGALWWIFSLAGVTLIYNIFVGIKGKEMAWQSRRFESLQQFNDTMRAWNTWGIFSIVLGIVLTILYFVAIFAMIAADPTAWQ